jgi:hypothetical protein
MVLEPFARDSLAISINLVVGIETVSPDSALGLFQGPACAGPAAAGSALRAHFSQAVRNAGYQLPPFILPRAAGLEFASAARWKSDCILLSIISLARFSLRKIKKQK